MIYDISLICLLKTACMRDRLNVAHQPGVEGVSGAVTLLESHDFPSMMERLYKTCPVASGIRCSKR